MPIRPLGKRVLIETLPEETMSGSIILPDYAVEKQCQGFVRALGNKFGDDDEAPEIGDKVWFRKGFGTDVFVNDKHHILIAYEYVLGVVT